MKKAYNCFVFGLFLAFSLLVESCQLPHATERQRFAESVRRELPFRVDSLSEVFRSDVTIYRFTSNTCIAESPDAEIHSDGTYWGARTFFDNPKMRQTQTEDVLWRNVVVSKRNQRVICVDRYLKQGKTQGVVYVYQSDSKKYPTYGRFHFDVSDTRNIELMGSMLETLRKQAVYRLNHDGSIPDDVPDSQDAYWKLIYHADSLMDEGLFVEAKQVYDLASTDSRYVLPSLLSTVANKMQAIGAKDIANEYLLRRVNMENDFYSYTSDWLSQELKDTFAIRQKRFEYDLDLKERLEHILECDNYDRVLWLQATMGNPQDEQRIERLAQRALATDSLNLVNVEEILSAKGFPSHKQVGTMAVQAVWIVFQHSDLENQKKFLPQLKDAVQRGDLPAYFLAMLQDRIDVREGRPQKYGTQWGSDGKLCPLLDAVRVNKWREEVGLPPIEIE